ncbi:MAG: hypothetical protein U0894_08495 [Pirellulales bacterium]
MPATMGNQIQEDSADPKFRSEGVAVGDYNKDGADIAAGPRLVPRSSRLAMHKITDADAVPEY